MAPTTFTLVVLKDDATETSFIPKVKELPPSDRPLYVGNCHHWIHSPHLSVEALTGSGTMMKRWDYLLINKASNASSLAFPNGLLPLVERKWSITAEVDDDAWLENYTQARRTRRAKPDPPLPQGWSSSDHSGLDAVVPPPDLEASLALASLPLGSLKTDGAKPTDLKKFTRDWGRQHTGPVNMLNLLAYVPDKRPQYFKYIAAFAESVGSKYGGDAMFFGVNVTGWSSKANEEREKPGLDASTGGWEDVGLVYYPSIWHFSKMLDDPGYAEVDRSFKQGVLRDNPILCCTEIDVDYSG